MRGQIAQALLNLATVTHAQADEQKARALLDESITLSRGTQSEINVSMDQGHLLLELGDYAAARSRYEEGLAMRRARNLTWLAACALLEVGHAAWLQGESAVTQWHAMEALGLFEEIGNRPGILAALESLSVAALAQGRTERAARLAGAAAALGEALGLAVPDWWCRPRERIGGAVRAAAPELEFAAAWAEGRMMSLDQAVAYGMEEAGTDTPTQ